MRRRVAIFAKDFLSALGECFLSEFPFADGDGIGAAIADILSLALLGAFLTTFVLLVCGFFSVTYDLMFDPNSSNVASRLATLSISPDKQV